MIYIFAINRWKLHVTVEYEISPGREKIAQTRLPCGAHEASTNSVKALQKFGSTFRAILDQRLFGFSLPINRLYPQLTEIMPPQKELQPTYLGDSVGFDKWFSERFKNNCKEINCYCITEVNPLQVSIKSLNQLLNRNFRDSENLSLMIFSHALKLKTLLFCIIYLESWNFWKNYHKLFD